MLKSYIYTYMLYCLFYIINNLFHYKYLKNIIIKKINHKFIDMNLYKINKVYN